MALSLTSIPTTPDDSPKRQSSPPRAGLGSDYVTILQKALKTKAPAVDLGKTGPGGDGVDGRYGNKTRAAVKAVADALSINKPFDDSGRPSAEMNKALGLADLTSSIPATAATATKSAPTPAAPASDDTDLPRDDSDPRFRVLSETSVEGKSFDPLAFVRAFPRKTLTDDSSLPDAILVLKQMQYALQMGGIATTAKMPIVATVRNQEQIDNYLSTIAEVVVEIKEQCLHVSASVDAAVKKKQKDENKPVTGPRPKGKGEVYPFEWVLWQAPRSAIQNVGKAQEIINNLLPSFVNGNSKSLLDLLKDTSHMNSIMGNSNHPLTEAKAKAIGKLIMNKGEGEFVAHIDPTDTSKYYDFNIINSNLVAMLQSVISKDPVQTQMIKIIKDE
jgi:hypothetical protein